MQWCTVENAGNKYITLHQFPCMRNEKQMNGVAANIRKQPLCPSWLSLWLLLWLLLLLLLGLFRACGTSYCFRFRILFLLHACMLPFPAEEMKQADLDKQKEFCIPPGWGSDRQLDY